MTRPSAGTRLRSLLKRLLPAPIRDGWRIYRRTSPGARPALLRLWLRSGATEPEIGDRQARRLLFVCHGNILRSAFAGALIGTLSERGLAPGGVTAASAGTHAIDGLEADPRGLRVAAELGVTLAQHRARRVTAEQLDAAHLVLVMDRVNEAELISRFPSSRFKVRRLARYLADASADIEDPYGGDEETIKNSFLRIDAAVRRLLETS